jgi:hypothetical protein
MRKLGPIGFPTLFQCPHLSNPGVSSVLAEFLEALGTAIAAYAEARVDVGDTGITLHLALIERCPLRLARHAYLHRRSADCATYGPEIKYFPDPIKQGKKVRLVHWRGVARFNGVFWTPGLDRATLARHRCGRGGGWVDDHHPPGRVKPDTSWT